MRQRWIWWCVEWKVGSEVRYFPSFIYLANTHVHARNVRSPDLCNGADRRLPLRYCDVLRVRQGTYGGHMWTSCDSENKRDRVEGGENSSAVRPRWFEKYSYHHSARVGDGWKRNWEDSGPPSLWACGCLIQGRRSMFTLHESLRIYSSTSRRLGIYSAHRACWKRSIPLHKTLSLASCQIWWTSLSAK